MISVSESSHVVADCNGSSQFTLVGLVSQLKLPGPSLSRSGSQSHNGPDVPEGRGEVIKEVGYGCCWLMVGIEVIVMVLSTPMVTQDVGPARRSEDAVAGAADTQIRSLYS